MGNAIDSYLPPAGLVDVDVDKGDGIRPGFSLSSLSQFSGAGAQTGLEEAGEPADVGDTDFGGDLVEGEGGVKEEPAGFFDSEESCVFHGGATGHGAVLAHQIGLADSGDDDEVVEGKRFVYVFIHIGSDAMNGCLGFLQGKAAEFSEYGLEFGQPGLGTPPERKRIYIFQRQERHFLLNMAVGVVTEHDLVRFEVFPEESAHPGNNGFGILGPFFMDGTG